MTGLLHVVVQALLTTLLTLGVLVYGLLVVLAVCGWLRDLAKSVRVRRARRRFTREALAEAQRRQRARDAAGPVDGDAWASALGQSSFAVDRDRMFRQLEELLHPTDGGQR